MDSRRAVTVVARISRSCPDWVTVLVELPSKRTVGGASSIGIAPWPVTTGVRGGGCGAVATTQAFAPIQPYDYAILVKGCSFIGAALRQVASRDRGNTFSLATLISPHEAGPVLPTPSNPGSNWKITAGGDFSWSDLTAQTCGGLAASLYLDWRLNQPIVVAISQKLGE